MIVGDPRPGIPVALPRRRPDVAQDDVSYWPHPLGGQNGTVALPSRQAALEGAAPPDAPGRVPPTDGQFGQILMGVFRGVFHAALGGGSRPYSPPAPLDRTRYVRRSYPNVGPIARFDPPMDGATSWTENASTGASPTPRSGIPFDLFHLGWFSFRRAFDQRIHADYMPAERPQMGSPSLGGQGAGARMLEPYFPRLTRRPEQTSFGQTTTTLQNPTPLPGPPTREQLFPGD